MLSCAGQPRCRPPFCCHRSPRPHWVGPACAQASLWSLAGVVTGLASWIVYWFVYDYATGSNAAVGALLLLYCGQGACHAAPSAGRLWRRSAAPAVCPAEVVNPASLPLAPPHASCTQAQQPRAAWDAALAGFSLIVLAHLALIVSGDYL